MKINQLDGLSADDRKALRIFVKYVHESLGDRVRRIVLYGSKARGTSQADSDIDVLVVVDRETRRVDEEVAEAAYQATVLTRSFVAPQTVSARYWRESQRERSFFSRNVDRDGVELTA